MRRNEKITHIMTAHPTTVQVGQPLSDASQIMHEGGFHHLPVLDGDRLVGMVTSTDLLRVTYAYGTDPRQTDAVLDHTMKLSDLMQPKLTVMTPEHTVRDAVETLAEGRFHSLPVVDAEGQLVGIVTTRDVLRYFLEQY